MTRERLRSQQALEAGVGVLFSLTAADNADIFRLLD